MLGLEKSPLNVFAKTALPPLPPTLLLVSLSLYLGLMHLLSFSSSHATRLIS